MEFNDNQFNQKSGPSRGRLFVFIGSFIGLVVLVAAPYYIWDKFFDAQAVSERKTQKQYEAFIEWEKNYEETMKNDTYGGKTPQETLDLFVAALRNDDLELASKYFALGSSLDKNDWLLELKNNTIDMLNAASKAIPTPDQKPSSKIFWFSVYSNSGEVEQLIEMSFNDFSNIWKIESL